MYYSPLKYTEDLARHSSAMSSIYHWNGVFPKIGLRADSDKRPKIEVSIEVETKHFPLDNILEEYFSVAGIPYKVEKGSDDKAFLRALEKYGKKLKGRWFDFFADVVETTA